MKPEFRTEKLSRLMSEELGAFHFRWQAARILMWLFPPFTGSRWRAHLMRRAGFNIDHSVVFWGMPQIIGPDNIYQHLTIGSNSYIGVKAFFDLAAPITIGENVVLGPDVMLITGHHEIGRPDKRLGELIPQPITIGKGVWIGARSTILPGVTIGSGAVVGAGAVVTRNILPNTLALGIPAKPVKNIDGYHVESLTANG